MEKVRVLRIIEYVGDRQWVESTLNSSYIPANGAKEFGESCIIKSATVDHFPEVLQQDIDIK